MPSFSSREIDQFVEVMFHEGKAYQIQGSQFVVMDNLGHPPLLGPKGERGDTGPTGDKGPVGDAGDPGDQGEPNTTKGVRGAQGDVGAKGAPGPIGETGDQGDQGPKGDVGDRGPTGLTGPPGLKGDVGPVGNPTSLPFTQDALTYDGAVISAMFASNDTPVTVTETAYTVNHYTFDFVKKREATNVVFMVMLDSEIDCALYVSSAQLSATEVVKHTSDMLIYDTVDLQNVTEFSALLRFKGNAQINSCSVVAWEVAAPYLDPNVGVGWRMIMSLPGDSTHWYEGDGNLKGYKEGEFLFTTGDFSRWLIADHEQVVEIFNAGYRTITKSSVNPNPHDVYWYHRGATPEDPLISLKGHFDSPQQNMMYLENGLVGYQQSLHESGMFVYTRGGKYQPPGIMPEELGTGWTEILSLPPNNTAWWSGDGNLDGYSGGEFLFTTTDFSRWLVTDHDQVVPKFGAGYRTVKYSSVSDTPYQAFWFHRTTNPEDPLISLKGHFTDNQNLMMFVENGGAGQPSARNNGGGLKVYTRGTV